ncbi:hypothetical protein [Actinomyces capricornis]|uniref:hypothetical protein n=1 Tax=Actinomyces capricornis TaxID=2755559 RepID=UPI001CC438EB|nr:hypothetical protein [Actinomyces capricornis]
MTAPDQHHGPRRCGIVAIAVAAALTCACSQTAPSTQSGATASGASPAPASTSTQPSAAASASTTAETVLGVSKDPATWSLPFDAIEDASLAYLKSYALDLLVDQCMSDAGFEDYEVLTPSSPPPGAQSAGKEHLFTVPIAQEHGYRKQFRQDSGSGDPSIYDNKPEAFHAQWNDCTTTSQIQLDAELSSGESDADWDARLSGFTVDTSGPELQDAAAQWHSCMEPQGIADLPEQPWTPMYFSQDMPESLTTAFYGDPVGPPSAEEIEVATADAQCRESSGWTSLLYETTWDQQAAFVEEHKAEVDARMAHNAAQTEKVRTVIRDHGGQL